ncbi:hypothetical protein MKK68_00985 [Methylobacterium sp. E-016]|nr:hypothetical protein [Methylobacterium sp. E-016]
MQIETTYCSAVMPAVMPPHHPHATHPSVHHAAGPSAGVHSAHTTVAGCRSVAIEAVAWRCHAGRVRAEQETKGQGRAEDELIHG